VEELGLPELTSGQIEKLCVIAEEAARRYVLSKISAKQIETHNISAGVEGTNPVTLTVDVDIMLIPSANSSGVQNLADEAVKEAFVAAEKYLEKLKCRSPK